MNHATAYLLFVGTGVLVWIVGSAWLCYRDGLPARRTLLLGTLVVASGLLGARLHSLLLETGLSITTVFNESHLLFSLGGWRLGGGLVVGLIAAIVLSGVLRLHLPTLLDAGMAVFGMGYALARLGCFVTGCCFGWVSMGPWVVRYPPETEAYLNHMERGLIPAGAAFSLPVHPFPLYAAAAALAVSVLLFRLRAHRRFRGEVGLLGMALGYGVVAGVEFLRESIGVRPVPMRQGFPAALAAGAVIVWAVARYRTATGERMRVLQ